METSATPPEADEFEVSLFGPGIGESIALHLGQDDWIVVDSCLDPESRRPAALGYFERLGLDIAKAVKLVVVTHWHDDHIRGAAEILERATSAHVAWSAKYDDDAFFRAVETARESRIHKTGLDEMSRMLSTLMDRRLPRQRKESVGPIWASEGTRLFSRDKSQGIQHAEVMSLSPSHGTQTLAMHEFKGLLPDAGEPQRRAVRVTPNQRSVVLSVTAGHRSALLGADLEDSPNPAVGWQAVVNSSVRPSARSEVFKVPHHGSANAHNEEVWTEMLSTMPVVCITPFMRVRNPLPTPDDISRMLDLSSRVYCTRSSQSVRPRPRPRAVEREIRNSTRILRAVEGKMGQVRIRGPLNGNVPLVVDLFGAAYQAR